MLDEFIEHQKKKCRDNITVSCKSYDKVMSKDKMHKRNVKAAVMNEWPVSVEHLVY